MCSNLLFPRNRQAISSAFGIVILAIIWILFAPAQVGGLASYVMVIGSSMEPRFHIGDLVVAHEQSWYDVGDAVVYRNTEMHGFVFHRIIAQDNGRFSLQGDNNTWVDTYQPSKKEVVGKLWFHIPGGGLVMQRIRSPWVMAVIAAILGAIVTSSLFRSKTKGHKVMSKSTVREWFDSVKQKARSWFTQVTTSAPQKPSGPDQGHITEGSLFALGLVLLSSLIIGIISFSRPTSRAVSNDLQYQHLAIFSYLASAPQSVYDSNAIKSGDPIFPLLTCAVDVNLQYTLIAQDAANITGTYQLTAIIREQISGWQRALPLQEETAFSGSTFGTTASLDLCKFEALTQSMEQETEFHPGAYTLVVMPNVKVNGSVSGRTLDATFNSGLKFHYDRVHFYLAQDTETGSPLSVTETGSIKEVRNEANTVVFLGSQIPVTVLRWMAVIGLVVSLAGFVFLGLKLQTLATTDQAQFFRVRHDALMVDVNNTDLLNSGHIVEVKSIEALAKLAERFNAMILHVEQDGSHQYLVQAGGTTYQFRLKADRTGTTVPANEPTEHGDEA